MGAGAGGEAAVWALGVDGTGVKGSIEVHWKEVPGTYQVADGPTRSALVQQLPSDVMGVARVLCFSVVQVPVINGLTDHSHSCQLMGVIAAAVA